MQIDAAFGALGGYLAERDGWDTPAWVQDPTHHTTAWYPAVPKIFRAEADRENPHAFRKCGIFIPRRSLARA
ncbi:hypothetical protein [Phytoactinopolyspora alkaliphila]|uniref:hypothetical protein n=1 Tax=Phytoactinopolyspora alkaliphila TaxID=1783498 RepID=UPI001C2086D9|nr:hypothetical protein [Phytoactinopolyspora alkaliphila]